jgi:hypothetical protein
MENNPAPKKMKLRLNLFDIIFIACALAAAALILLYSSRSDGGTSIIISGSSETVVYTLEFQGMLPGTAELISPGDSLVDRVERRAIGTVVSVELMPSTTSQKSFVTGNRYIVDVPGRTDAVVVVTANAHVTEGQISVNGFAVRVGTRVSINGPLYNGVGFIIGIERGDAA